MRAWDAARIAQASGAVLAGPPSAPAGTPGPVRAVIDSREAGEGDLFVGLPGVSHDGGAFAAQALAAGAWGALVTPGHAGAAVAAGAPGTLLAADDPLEALQLLARAWREELGAQVIGITGSTGKTSTKDILSGMLAPQRSVVATEQNLNTEIGLPLTILRAPAGTEVLVLEMAMRGEGQIAELARIARPDVGVIVNVGPVHLELLGSIEAIARTKAELINGLAPGATAIVPAGEVSLAPYLRDDVHTVTFGPGGDVEELPAGVRFPLTAAHMRSNALAALAAARAVGVEPSGDIDVALSRMRGQRLALTGGVTVIDDCYNANPMSMRAALDDLAETAPARRVAVLGDMLELGPEEVEFHRDLGRQAAAAGVALLITVGPLAAQAADGFGDAGIHGVDDAGQAASLLGELVEDGDTILVKASRGMHLETVAQTLSERLGAADEAGAL